MIGNVRQREELVSFLKNRATGTLASVNEGGAPDASVIYFYLNHDLSFHFVTKKDTRKIRNVLKNPIVSFVVYDSADLTSVEILGQVAVVEDTIEIVRVFDQYTQMIDTQGPQCWRPPIAQIEAGDYVACRLRPRRIFFRKFGREKGESPSSFELLFT